MIELPKPKLPPEQQAIRGKCFHPSGKYIEFPQEDGGNPQEVEGVI
jgi:hypothetical protein